MKCRGLDIGGLGEILTYASVAIFVLGIATFAIIYRRILLQTREDYENDGIILQIQTATLHKLKGEKREPNIQKIWDTGYANKDKP